MQRRIGHWAYLNKYAEPLEAEAEPVVPSVRYLAQSQAMAAKSTNASRAILQVNQYAGIYQARVAGAPKT